MSDYTWRAATPADLTMLRDWLATPEVVRWWGDPDPQYALVEGDIPDPRMTTLIVSHLGVPIAYAQHYQVDAWPEPHYAGLPHGTRAIDPFIGVAGAIGRGHGRRFLRLLAQSLLDEGAPLVVIDPDPDNARACRAYAAAGFGDAALVDTGDGPAMLMRFCGRD